LTAQVKIQALAFSPDEQRLASLGGQDDNSLVRMGCKAWWCSTIDTHRGPALLTAPLKAAVVHQHCVTGQQLFD
jgi:hypothetical protein